MRRTGQQHIMMEIPGSEMGSLPIPKPRRNTSRPNLVFARTSNKAITNTQQNRNMLRVRCGLVVALLRLCCVLKCRLKGENKHFL
jgi:hypothetical protein